MKPVAVYARYSTEEQDPRSIDDQCRRCGDYANTHKLAVVATFPDAAESGSHTDRPALRALLAAAMSPRPAFRAILVDDLGRLSRDMGGTWRILDELAGAGISVIDVRTGISSEDPSARVFFGASSLVNDQFLQLVRYQTHRGLQGRAIAGFATGGTIYGYRTVAEPSPSDPDHPRKRWVIDEAEASVVRRIFVLLEDGLGYRAIADLFNREGVPAPRNAGRGGKHGGGWGHTSVRAIVCSERYVGRWAWNTHKWIRKPNSRIRRRIPRPASEHVVIEVPELAIVDAATWARASARLAARAHGGDRPAPKNRHQYLLSGLLRCGVCGGPLSISGAKIKAGRRYANYACTAHVSRGPTVCSMDATISERKISAAVIRGLRAVLSGQSFVAAFERRVAERRRAERSAPNIERELEAARRRVANATRLIVESPDDLDLRKQREIDRAEVQRLAGLAAAGAAPMEAPPSAARLEAALSSFVDELAENPAAGRAALARVLTPLTVTPAVSGGARFVVTGAIDLARVSGCGRSGGLLAPHPETSLLVPLRCSA
jgi:site-specific DNA recombinase